MVAPPLPPDPVAPVLSGIVLKNADGKAVTDITLHVGSSAQLTAELATISLDVPGPERTRSPPSALTMVPGRPTVTEPDV